MKASLNHIFRTIWSEALNTWIAVSELTPSKGKSKSCVLNAAALAANDSESGNIAKSSGRLRIKPLVFALACGFSVNALANPIGGQVVNGAASINQVGNVLTVTNTPNAIINWQGFSIGKGETTNFIQQSASSSVLNKVMGPDPSLLLGNLTSNGRVFLINPAGILVGQGANINVPGFVASTLNLSNADYLAGNLNFTANPNAVSIQNNGTITTPEGGSVYLVAPQVTNNGIINTPKGETILAAGNTVQLLDTGTPGVSVRITGSDNTATNLGQILADSGRIGMVGALVNNRGTLNANSVVSHGGKIFLKATQDTYVQDQSSITATGTTGGNIEVLGNRVAITDNSVLNASGTQGGGTILIGGDAHGTNLNIQNAQATFIGTNVMIQADAAQTGNGGKVVVWSDGITQFNGNISAQGGAQSGNGGWVETSGKQTLGFAGLVNTTASHGLTGTLLLDPTDITISTAADTGSMTNTSGTFADITTTSSSSNLNTTTLQTQLGLSNVIVDTTSGLAGAGNINVAAPIAWNSANSLTLIATGSGYINQMDGNSVGHAISNLGTGGLTMQTANGQITIFQVNLAGGTFTANAAGSVGNINMMPSGLINTGAGNINLTAGLNINGGYSVITTSGTLNTVAAGSIGFGGLNAVSNFSATAGTSGILFNDTVTTLGLNALSVTGTGISVTNTGAIAVNGAISAGAAGVQLTSTGSTISEGVNGSISSLLGLQTSSVGGTTLNGANAFISFIGTDTTGSISLKNTAATLTLGAITTGGTLLVKNIGNLTVGGAIAINGTGAVAGLPAGVNLSGILQAGGGAQGYLITNNSTINLLSGGLGFMFVADQMNLDGIHGTSHISAPASQVILNTVTPSVLTDLGTTTKGTAGTLQISQADLATITSPVIALVVNSNINITAPINVGTSTLNLIANASNGGGLYGSISETGAGSITAGALITSSGVPLGGSTFVGATGTTLNGANSVGSFTATDTTGAVSLTNTATALSLGAISSSGLTINNTGAVVIGGAIAEGASSIALTASGTISEITGGSITGGALTTSAVGGTTLTGGNPVNAFSPALLASNTVSGFSATDTGDVSLGNTFGALTLGSITTGGALLVNNKGNITVSNAIAINGSGLVSGTVFSGGLASSFGGAMLTMTSTGRISISNNVNPFILNADTMTLGGSVSDTSGPVILNTYNNVVTDLGSTTKLPSTFVLSQTELATISAPTLMIDVNNTLNISAPISFAGTLNLSSYNPTWGGAAIVEGAGGAINAGTLITTSLGGTTLNRANTVGSFSATDTTGAVTLTNTATTLTLGAISSSGLKVANTGSLNITGLISAGTGGVSLGASGDVISNAAIQTSGSVDLWSGWNGNAVTPGVLLGTGNITLNASVLSAGALSLLAGNTITLNDTGSSVGSVTINHSASWGSYSHSYLGDYVATSFNLAAGGAINLGANAYLGGNGSIVMIAGWDGNASTPGVVAYSAGKNITLNGGVGSPSGGNVSLLAADAINIAATATNFAGIDMNTGTLNMAADKISLTALGNNGQSMQANIVSNGDQYFTLTGGSGVSTSKLSLVGANGANAWGGSAQILRFGSTSGGQNFTFSNGSGLLIQGGNGGGYAPAQTWTGNCDGYFGVLCSSNNATIENQALGGQTFTFSSGSTLTMIGGSVGNNNNANISNRLVGVQTITGNPVMSITGGSSGGAMYYNNGTDPNNNYGIPKDQYFDNAAGIDSDISQTINAASITLNGGSATFGSAYLISAAQTITTTGNVTLIGGSAAAPTAYTAYGQYIHTDAAFIGNDLAAAPHLTVGGNLTLTGGAVSLYGGSAAMIGSLWNSADVIATVAGNIALNAGSAIGAGANNISLTANGVGSTISEAVAGAISTTGTLTTNSVAGTTLSGTNLISRFNVSNSGSGNISLTNAAALNITGISQAGGGAVNITNTGNITTSGLISGDGNINLFAIGNVADDVTISNGINYTGAVGAGNLEIRANRNVMVQTNSIQSTGTQALNVIINADRNADNSGSVAILAGGDILSNGGNITIGGGVNPSTGYAVGNGTTMGNTVFSSGIDVLGNITAGAGNVIMNGRSAAAAGDGITLAGGTLSSNGLVNLSGVTSAAGNSTPSFVAGVYFTNTGTRLTTATGTINVNGSSISSGAFSQGVLVNSSATVETTGTGTLSFNASSSGIQGSWAMGIINGGTLQTTASGGGMVSLTGTAVQDGGIVIGSSPTSAGNVLSNGGDIRMIFSGGTNSILLSGPVTIGGNNSGNILLSGSNGKGIYMSGTTISSMGNVTVNAIGGGAVTQTGGSITAAGLRLLGDTNATFSLTSATNHVTTLAGNLTGATSTLSYADSGAFGIGSISSFDGTATTNTSGLNLGTATPNTLTLNAGGALSETQSITAGVLNTYSAGGTSLSGSNSIGSFNATNTTGGGISLTNTIPLTIAGINQSGGGAVSITNTGNITLNSGSSINAGAGILNMAATGSYLNINGAVTAGTFSLNGGTWNQIGATLPSFTVSDFRIAGGTFIRALGGNGSTATPYQLSDIYGVQGIGSAGMLTNSFVLAKNIDASGTTSWNAGAGFAPIGITTPFTGIFDGLSHTINNLTINMPSISGVGLFGSLGIGSIIRNVGLVGGSVLGYNTVGELAGGNNGSISNVYATGTVTGHWAGIGGLVGWNSAGTITNSYFTGTVNGADEVGGLVGLNGGYGTNGYNNIQNALINNSYASATINASRPLGGDGGLVGHNRYDSALATGGVVSNSFWNSSTAGTVVTLGIGYDDATSDLAGRSPGTNNVQLGTNNGANSLNSTQMTQLSSFSSWNTATPNTISNTGGSGAIWRIYEGHSAPLLTSFLTPLTLIGTADATVTYNGIAQNGMTTATTGVLGVAATGTNAGFYNGYYSTQQGFDITGGNLTINPATLTLSGTRSYDGSTIVTGSVLTANGVVGQTFTLTGSGDASNLGSKNVQANSALASVTGLSLGTSGNGGLASNYNPISITGSSVSVTQLSSVSAVGNGNWSSATTWAGGAIPDLANVATVYIPSGTTVTYDSGVAGTTTLTSLTSSAGNTGGYGNLIMAAGALSSTGIINLASYSQTGGTLSGNGNFTVTNNFSQTGGVMALNGSTLTITQATGNINLTNTGIITLGGLTASSGNISVNNTGAVTTTGAITANATVGTVTITAHSPLTIGIGGVNAGGNITLTAGSTSGGTLDILTLNGLVNSIAGNIYLSAGNSILPTNISSFVSAPNGIISMLANLNASLTQPVSVQSFVTQQLPPTPGTSGSGSSTGNGSTVTLPALGGTGTSGSSPNSGGPTLTGAVGSTIGGTPGTFAGGAPSATDTTTTTTVSSSVDNTVNTGNSISSNAQADTVKKKNTQNKDDENGINNNKDRPNAKPEKC